MAITTSTAKSSGRPLPSSCLRFFRSSDPSSGQDQNRGCRLSVMAKFNLVAPFEPTGDQPQPIAKLTDGVLRGDKFQTLLGATGSGKTFTISHVIKNVGKPTLVVSHNKT